MTAPAPAVAPVTHGLSHELTLELNIGTGAAPQWQKVRFTSGLDPSVTPTTEDATTYDDEGTDRVERIGETWALPFTINRYRDAAGGYMPEAEVLRKAGDPGVRGDEAKVEVRWYDKLGADEAYQGEATVGWKRGNTNAKGLATATVTLNGSGPLKVIANPAAGA